MKATRTEGDVERLLDEMVGLVRKTYPTSTSAGDGPGLARLEHAWSQQRSPARSTGMRLLVGATAMVALVLAGALLFQQFGSLTYEVTNGSIGPGGVVRPTAAGATIVFSEGSEIALGEAARTRVDGLTSDGGRIVVESGSVHARIVHRKRTHWVVEAGPYTIRVTGTAFNVKWSSTSELLDLQMDHGSVIVTGPLAPGGVTLSGGMRLTVNPRTGLAIAGGVGTGRAAVAIAPSRTLATEDDGRPALAATATAPAVGVVDSMPPSDLDPPDVQKPRAGGRLKGVGQVALARRSDPFAFSSEPWDRQLAHGNIQSILADADRRGVERVLGTVSGRELSALADAARYGHRPALARRALLSMRDRFPRSPESREAAFFLGGLAEDAGGANGSSSALEWYERYLSDGPGGRYAGQALGRKMVITQRMEGTSAARALAETYVARFPDGPYAPAARKLLRSP